MELTLETEFLSQIPSLPCNLGKSESLLGLNLILSSCDSITVYFSLQHCSEHLWDSHIRVRRFSDVHRALHIPRNILCTIKYRSLSVSKEEIWDESLQIN